MSDSYSQLLTRLSTKYEVSIEQIESRVANRQSKVFGLISKSAAARTVGASMAIGAAEQKFSAFVAAGAHHVSGLKVTDAIAAATEEAKAGHWATLGYWPPANEAPAVIASHYMRALDCIAESGLTSSISIKVDQLQFEREVLFDVLRHSMLRRVRVHFDAQAFETADRTLALLEEGLALGADLSAAVPSRWARSMKDAQRLVQLGVPLRIVKGQGGDPGNPKIDPRRSYLELVESVAGTPTHVGIATHDRRVAEPALDLLIKNKTPCSLEQLRSLPRLDFLAEARGIPVRAYVAYGVYGLPYVISEVLRRPAILGWIVRDLAVRRRA
jgi:hypothetical protein